MLFAIQATSTFYVFFAAAAPLVAPTVHLDNGIFTGNTDGVVQRFLGIPFAQPPVGSLRYQLPQTILPYNGSYTATSYGPACPQTQRAPILTGLAPEAVNYVVNSVYGLVFPDSEDCLTLNIVKPSNASPSSQLPVLVWIYGGGFNTGSTSIYDGGLIVSRSLVLKSPVVYVSINYRLGGFGFLPGQEVKNAGVGNLGLQDQREALRWIKKYISHFGGDPDKVTIWGQSAGAVSSALHLVANNGNNEGLFRAAFMESGAAIPVGDIANGQQYYDQVVIDTGCSGALDTLACLRTVPFQALKDAIQNAPGIFSYQSLRLVWVPRADGVLITDDPQKLVEQGKIANVPFVTGNVDDEGTLYSLSTLNITSEEEFKEWIKNTFLLGSTDADVDKIAGLYPGDITKGSPFDTGILNALTPQYKRLAAFQGDVVFQAPRRWLLRNAVPSNPNVWSYVSKRFKALPALGSVHAHDLVNVYGGGEMGAYLIKFASTLDPNHVGGLHWPQYNLKTRKLLTFLDLPPVLITEDDYRKESMEFLTEITLTHPL